MVLLTSPNLPDPFSAKHVSLVQGACLPLCGSKMFPSLNPQTHVRRNIALKPDSGLPYFQGVRMHWNGNKRWNMRICFGDVLNEKSLFLPIPNGSPVVFGPLNDARMAVTSSHFREPQSEPSSCGRTCANTWAHSVTKLARRGEGESWKCLKRRCVVEFPSVHTSRSHGRQSNFRGWT